jgi:hypothetical protein
MKILNIFDVENQTAIIDYRISVEEELLFKQLAKEQKKRYSKKFVNDYVLGVLKECLKETKQNRKDRTFTLKSGGNYATIRK